MALLTDYESQCFSGNRKKTGQPVFSSDLWYHGESKYVKRRKNKSNKEREIERGEDIK